MRRTTAHGAGRLNAKARKKRGQFGNSDAANRPPLCDTRRSHAMPFRIAKRFVVETGHLLSKHPGACRFPHGHSRTIEIVVSAAVLDANDMVCDFKALKAAAAGIVARYDHAFALNTADPQFPALRASYGERVIGFAGADPTSELLARAIFHAVRESMAATLRPEVKLERVRVTETESSWAEYWE